MGKEGESSRHLSDVFIISGELGVGAIGIGAVTGDPVILGIGIGTLSGTIALKGGEIVWRKVSKRRKSEINTDNA